MINRMLLGFCCIFLFACNPSKKLKTTSPDIPKVNTTYQFPYQINEPQQSFKLPKILKEISGLSFSAKDKLIYAVQDENGLFFKIDPKTGILQGENKQTKFYEDGDYEGVEVVGDKIYVVKSTGTIYELSNIEKGDIKIEKYKSFIKKPYNVEGLTYDSNDNSLILACKATPETVDPTKSARGVYKFDLKTKEMSMEPLFTIDKSAIVNFIQTKVTEDKIELFSKIINNPKDFKLGPSGIAIHPITKNKYVISSKGKLFIVINPKGEIIHIEKLNKKIHFQPEGIAFDPNGMLYISTEADDHEAAYIYKFEMNSKK